MPTKKLIATYPAKIFPSIVPFYYGDNKEILSFSLDKEMLKWNQYTTLVKKIIEKTVAEMIRDTRHRLSVYLDWQEEHSHMQYQLGKMSYSEKAAKIIEIRFFLDYETASVYPCNPPKQITYAGYEFTQLPFLLKSDEMWIGKMKDHLCNITKNIDTHIAQHCSEQVISGIFSGALGKFEDAEIENLFDTVIYERRKYLWIEILKQAQGKKINLDLLKALFQENVVFQVKIGNSVIITPYFVLDNTDAIPNYRDCWHFREYCEQASNFSYDHLKDTLTELIEKGDILTLLHFFQQSPQYVARCIIDLMLSPGKDFDFLIKSIDNERKKLEIDSYLNSLKEVVEKFNSLPLPINKFLDCVDEFILSCKKLQSFKTFSDGYLLELYAYDAILSCYEQIKISYERETIHNLPNFHNFYNLAVQFGIGEIDDKISETDNKISETKGNILSLEKEMKSFDTSKMKFLQGNEREVFIHLDDYALISYLENKTNKTNVLLYFVILGNENREAAQFLDIISEKFLSGTAIEDIQSKFNGLKFWQSLRLEKVKKLVFSHKSYVDIQKEIEICNAEFQQVAERCHRIVYKHLTSLTTAPLYREVFGHIADFYYQQGYFKKALKVLLTPDFPMKEHLRKVFEDKNVENIFIWACQKYNIQIFESETPAKPTTKLFDIYVK